MSNQVKPLTPEQDVLLQRWRALALQRMAYFAPLLFEVVPVCAPGLGTFAVDRAWRLYIDFDAVTPRGDVFCSEALLHEAGHLYLDHAGRADDLGLTRNGRFVSEGRARSSNVAADCEINDDLRDAGCGAIAAAGVLPERIGCPDFETYEFYFARLDTASGSGDDSPSDGSGDGDGSGSGDSADGSGSGDSADGSGSGSGGPVVLDRGCGSGAGSAPTSWEQDAGDVAGGVSDAAKDRAVTSTAVRVQQAAKSRGNVPAGLVARAVQVLAPPLVAWQQVLAAAVRRGAGSRPGDVDTSFTRRNRRRHNTYLGGRRVIFPGDVKPEPRIVVVRDTSGSMGPSDLDRVTAEVDGIARKMGVRGDALRVLDTDADAYTPRRYTGASSIAEVVGGGGTDMRVGIDAAAGLDPRPNVVVVITDGYTPWPDTRRKGVAVVACIVGEAEQVGTVVAAVPEWIRTVTVPPVGA